MQVLDADYMTVQETARYLKASPQTVRRMIREGKLAGMRLGSGPNARFRVSTISIERMLERKSH